MKKTIAERLILKLNHVIFWWYYKRCGKHFAQYTFFNSIKILIGNYYHTDDWRKSSDKLLGEVIRENTKLHSKINAMELKKLIDESSVDFINNTFGLRIPKASDN